MTVVKLQGGVAVTVPAARGVQTYPMLTGEEEVVPEGNQGCFPGRM